MGHEENPGSLWKHKSSVAELRLQQWGDAPGAARLGGMQVTCQGATQGMETSSRKSDGIMV